MYGPEVGTYVRTMPLLLPSHEEHGTGLRNQKREETINFEKISGNFEFSTHNTQLERAGESRREQQERRREETERGKRGPRGLRLTDRIGNTQ